MVNVFCFFLTNTFQFVHLADTVHVNRTQLSSRAAGEANLIFCTNLTRTKHRGLEKIITFTNVGLSRYGKYRQYFWRSLEFPSCVIFVSCCFKHHEYAVIGSA